MLIFNLNKKLTAALLLLPLLLLADLSAGSCCGKKRGKNCFTPFQLSVAPNLQTSPSCCDVNGIRINLPMGENRNVSGIDLGIINYTTGNMSGYEFGIVNVVKGDVNGVQRGIFNKGNNVRGAQDGFVNICERRVAGLQEGFINCAPDVTGAQVGFAFNSAKRVRGVQIGLINCTRHLKGAQIGLLNIQTSRRYLKVVPLLNISTSYGRGRAARVAFK